MKSLLILLAPVLLAAQGFDTRLGTETAELMGGVLHQHSGGGTDPAFAGKVLAGLCQYASLYGEYSYSRVYSQTLYPGPTIKSRASISDFGGGAEFHLSGSRIQPYALAGLGSVRQSAKFSYGADSSVSSVYHFAYSLGGGSRFFVTHNFGFVVEAKSVAGMDFSRFERYAIGVFFQRQRPDW